MHIFLKKNIFYFFGMVVFADLAFVFFNLPEFRCISKPLLIPFLLIALFLNTRHTTGRTIIAFGLFFSFLGDLFLLNDHAPAFFIAGLCSFLLTHILYSVYFLQFNRNKIITTKRNMLTGLLTAAYALFFLYLLKPGTGNIYIPVVIYTIFISFMFFSAMAIYPHIKPITGRYYIAGAGIFVLSDSLLAINKFYQPFPAAGIMIMLTYCLAQLFIVKGFINNAD